MGLGTKTLLLLFCISFVFTIAPNPSAPNGYGYGTLMNNIADYLTGYDVNMTEAGLEATNVSTPSLWDIIRVDTILAAGGASIVAYVAAYSTGYGIFASIAVFIMSLVAIPQAIFSQASMPVELKVFVGGAFFILILVSALSFFRGYEW